MLEKTLESKLDDYFYIVPKDLFEEAQEKAFKNWSLINVPKTIASC